MALSSIGDLARSYALRNQTTGLKLELERRSNEATTGKTADAGRLLGGDFTRLSAIDASLSRLQTFRDVAAEVTSRADGMQAVLGTLATLSDQLASSLLSLASPGSAASVATLGQDAVSRLRTAVGTLNTRLGDRTLFAGVETRSAATLPADDLLALARGAAAGATSAGGVEAALTFWFEDPSGYAASVYLGGAPVGPQEVAAGKSVALDTTANDPAIRDTLKALVMAALLDGGILAGKPDERAQLAKRSGEMLLEGAEGRTLLAARVGTAQERIASAETRNAAEGTSLRIGRIGMVDVDGYEAATGLTQAEAQLDTLYAITARLQRLSLADYL